MKMLITFQERKYFCSLNFLVFLSFSWEITSTGVNICGMLMIKKLNCQDPKKSKKCIIADLLGWGSYYEFNFSNLNVFNKDKCSFTMPHLATVFDDDPLQISCEFLSDFSILTC